MCDFQKVDFHDIVLQDRPGGWLDGDFIFDEEAFQYNDEEIKDFLLDNASMLLAVATHFFCSRELGISMTKMFYIFDEQRQTIEFVAHMNMLFERMSVWYEQIEDGKRYMVIQGEGISEQSKRVLIHMENSGQMDEMLERLFMKAHFCNDVEVTGYYCLKKMQSAVTISDQCENKSLVTRLFEEQDFKQYGSINVSGLSMEQIKKEPVVEKILDMANHVYLYVFDVCSKSTGQKTRQYIKILRWNMT